MYHAVRLQVLAAAVVARRALQSEGASHQALEHAQSLAKAVRTLCRVAVRTAFPLLTLLDTNKLLRCVDMICNQWERGGCTNDRLRAAQATFESQKKAAVPGKPTSEELGGQLAFAESAQSAFKVD